MSVENGSIMKAIDLLVRQGRARHVMIDGKPGLELIRDPEKDAAAEDRRGDPAKS